MKASMDFVRNGETIGSYRFDGIAITPTQVDGLVRWHDALLSYREKFM